jgi:hypothetical protein
VRKHVTTCTNLKRFCLGFFVFVLAWVVPLVVPIGQAQVFSASFIPVNPPGQLIVTSTVTLNLVAGWNLVGNSSSGTLNVAAVFGDTTKVITVWKWEAAKINWAFYTPVQTDGGAAYAAGKGYDLLSTVNGGEGFWVNAKTAFTVQMPAGTSVTSASFQSILIPGWNLISTGDSPTPRQFDQALSLIAPAAGDIPLNITSLWAWDANLINWYFYAPSLDANATLSSYIVTKGYLDFGTTVLDPALGFWVNLSTTATTTAASTTTTLPATTSTTTMALTTTTTSTPTTTTTSASTTITAASTTTTLPATTSTTTASTTTTTKAPTTTTTTSTPTTTTTTASTTTTTIIAGGLGCPSIYDGTYIGQFAYSAETYYDNNLLPTIVVPAGGFNVTVTLQCVVNAGGSIVLNITHAIVSHPKFGCQGGCTPLPPLSWALLPASPPTGPFNQSLPAQGIQISFPNGTSLFTTDSANALSVSSTGSTISYSLDPGIAGNTWFGLTSANDPIPPLNARIPLSTVPPGFQQTGWNLTKSAF